MFTTQPQISEKNMNNDKEVVLKNSPVHGNVQFWGDSDSNKDKFEDKNSQSESNNYEDDFEDAYKDDEFESDSRY